MNHKVNRNTACPCGSGIKYKYCCLKKQKYQSIEQVTKSIFAILIKVRDFVIFYHSGFISLVIFIGLIYIYTYFSKTQATIFGGEIYNKGDIELSYYSEQRDGISPLCGCFKEQSKDEYRGISFVADNVSILRGGGLPFTSYLLTASFPAEITWTPSPLAMNIKYYKIMKSFYDFEPKDFFKNKDNIKKYVAEAMEFEEIHAAIIFTEKELKISLSEENPIGCWIPVKKSKIVISKRKGIYDQNISYPYIRETYDSLDLKIKPRKDGIVNLNDNYAEYPIADFLGPQIILWSSGDSRISVGNTLLPTTNNTTKNSHHVNLLVIDAPFSIRIACQPVSSGFIKRVSSDFSMPFVPRDSGFAEISINGLENQNHKYYNFYKKIKENGIVWRDVVLYNATDNKNNKGPMNFRYPPLPPEAGYNIFGGINNLKLYSATGNMMIDSEPVTVIAPSILELRDVSVFKYENDEGTIKVPIQYNGKDSVSRLGFQGVGSIYLNNKPVRLKADVYKQNINIVLNIIQLLTFFITVILFYKKSKEA